MKKDMITYKNKKYTVDEFCGEFAISMTTFNKKYKEEGLSVEEIIKSTIRRRNSKVIYNSNYSCKLWDFCSNNHLHFKGVIICLENGISITEIMEKLKVNKKFNLMLTEHEIGKYISGIGEYEIRKYPIISSFNASVEDVITAFNSDDNTKDIKVEYNNDYKINLDNEKFVCYKGKYYSIPSFCNEFGINVDTFLKKVKEETPLREIISGTKRTIKSIIIYNNKKYNIKELCNKYNINNKVFIDALKSGIGVTEIITKWKKGEPFKWDQSQKKPEERIDYTDDEQLKTAREILPNSDLSFQVSPSMTCINTMKMQNNIQVSSPMTFIDIINMKSLFPVSNINLIDYENICNDVCMVKKYLNEDDDAINIFFFNSCIYSNKFFKALKNLKKIDRPVFYVITDESEDQLIDHLIMYYAGVLLTKFKGLITTITIVSKDSHFYKIKKYISTDKLKVEGMDYIEDKDDKFIISIANYLINNRYINNNSAIKPDEFGIIFKNFFKLRNKQMTKDNLNSLIDRLTSLGFLVYHEETNTYSEYYSIDLITTKQNLRRIKKNRAA